MRRKSKRPSAELLQWYRSLKIGRSCIRCGVQCGTALPPECFDWDHRPEFKKFMDVSRMLRLGYSKELIIKELQKCSLLCSNCHRIVTVTRRQNGSKFSKNTSTR